MRRGSHDPNAVLFKYSNAFISGSFVVAQHSTERTSQAGASVSSGGVTSTPPAKGTEGWLAKIPRALVATALSLLTPVILSLIVLYCTAEMLQQDRSELLKREANLVADEQDLRKTERSAAADLQKENIELMRLLRAPPPSPKP